MGTESKSCLCSCDSGWSFLAQDTVCYKMHLQTTANKEAGQVMRTVQCVSKGEVTTFIDVSVSVPLVEV